MRSHLDSEVIDRERRWLLSTVAIGIAAAGAGSFSLFVEGSLGSCKISYRAPLSFKQVVSRAGIWAL